MKQLKKIITSVGISALAATALTAQAQTFNIKSVSAIGTDSNHPPQNAINGNQNNRWRGNSSNPQEQIIFDLGAVQRVDNVFVDWHRGNTRTYNFQIAGRSGTSGSWTTIFTGTAARNNNLQNYNVNDINARQIRILSNRSGVTEIERVEIVGVQGRGSPFGLNRNNEPWENYDLDDWALDSPEGRSSNPCQSRRVNEDDWDEVPGTDTHDYFFTHSDGGMRFVSPIGGSTTSSSCNSGFPRSELREMLRRGNTNISTTGVNGNNWALGYQPGNSNHGGRNGELKATLRINRVTTTGSGLHPGRTIIGQIHAADDEPLRLYYRKRPGAARGCIYAEHEIRNGNDVTFNLIGNEQCNGNGPSNGIALNELFSYEIRNRNEDIRVRIRRGDQNGPIIRTITIDMDNLDSGYDRSNEWMYFKAGLYTQNNTGNNNDRDIATFYRLSNTHDNN